ncbi:MAG: DUF3084 domain-containing protein [Negativicutes bacterium]|nr:DUF3084 domain-containing protein [Negativicutes bacterium]
MKLYSYGIILVLVLAITGGIIAWLGDWLGSLVGKKRISLFGMRPRHTSRLFTVAAGVLTVFVSLAVMSAVSRDVRTALFGVEELKQQIAVLDGEVASRNAALDDSRGKLAEVERQFDFAQTTLRSAQDEVRRAIRQRDQARFELANAEWQLGDYRQRIAAADATIAEMSKTRQTLADDIDRLTKFNEQLKLGFDKLKTGTVIYRAGEILWSEAVRGQHDVQSARQVLNRIMNSVNASILEDLNIKSDMQVVWADGEQLAAAGEKIGGGDGSFVVRVFALGNVVYGEPVVVGISVYGNRLLYKAGDVVYAQTVILGGDNTPENVLTAFLPKVNAAAVASGILADPVTGRVGIISGEEYYRELTRLRGMSGTVTVAAVALRDAYTAGPLEIELKISQQPAGPANLATIGGRQGD